MTGRYVGFLITPAGSREPVAGAFASRSLRNTRHPLPLAAARRLAPGPYRLTYLGDGSATIDVPVRGLRRGLSLQPYARGLGVHYWTGPISKVPTGANLANRPVGITARTYSLVFAQISRARSPMYVQACLSATPTICEDDAGSATAHVEDCPDTCSQGIGRGQEYFPGELEPGSYYALWESVTRGRADVVAVLMTLEL